MASHPRPGDLLIGRGTVDLRCSGCEDQAVQHDWFARGGVHFELGKTDVVRQGFVLRSVTACEDLAEIEQQRCGWRDPQHWLGTDMGGGA